MYKVTIKNMSEQPLVDESESTINQITLDCLLNRTQYEKYVSKKLLNQISRKDQLFYRKRAVNLTKELLKGNEDVFVSPDVKYAFECYIKTCIRYFRVLDKSDLIQEEYKSLNLASKMSDEEEEIKQSLDELDELLFTRKINFNPNNGTLDNFVEIISLVQEDMVVIPPPQQRKINLKDPILRNKGIRKKKNIENKYNNEKQKVEEKVQKVGTITDEEKHK
jgi:hypothetical protein